MKLTDSLHKLTHDYCENNINKTSILLNVLKDNGFTVNNDKGFEWKNDIVRLEGKFYKDNLKFSLDLKTGNSAIVTIPHSTLTDETLLTLIKESVEMHLETKTIMIADYSLDVLRINVTAYCN